MQGSRAQGGRRARQWAAAKQRNKVARAYASRRVPGRRAATWHARAAACALQHQWVGVRKNGAGSTATRLLTRTTTPSLPACCWRCVRGKRAGKEPLTCLHVEGEGRGVGRSVVGDAAALHGAACSAWL